MPEVDALLLARLQFAFTISFHIIFPALTIGLATYLALLKLLWLKTNHPYYHALFDFWVKPFALCFSMGVVSGIVMAYQFGTNWRGFSEFSGAITGPLLSYEVMTAFFLEAGFLGVMIFGRQRVGEKWHFFATSMVAAGTIISSFWILASNSWMQTPQGHSIENNMAIPVDWWQVIFNPSFPYRFLHMTTAAFLSSAFFIAAVAAWQLLNKAPSPLSKKMLSMALWLIVALAPLQIIIGDFHGLNTLKHQPAKIAAMEGHWEVSDSPSPLILVGWPDMEAERTRFKLEIPYLGSLILHHDLSTPIPALKAYPPEDRANSTLVFWSFRLMVGLGFLMLGLAFWSLWLRYKHQLYASRLFLRCVFYMGPSGLIALLAGWVTTEVGRQPWVVYGLLRTAHAVSAHTLRHMQISLSGFVIVYCLIFGVGFVYLWRLVRTTPRLQEHNHD